MPDNQDKDDLEALKGKVLERSINLFLLLAVAITLILFYRFYETGEYVTLIGVFSAGLVLMVLRLFGETIPHGYKVGFIVLLILFVVGIGVYNFGIVAGALPYIVMVPAFTFLTSNKKAALLTLLLALLLCGWVASAYISGELTYFIDINEYVAKPTSWILNLSIIFFTSVVILDIISVYDKSIRKSYQKISKQRQKLKEIVDQQTIDLKSSNEDLKKNVADLKRTQSQLLNAEKMASLGMLTAGIAHELKNPLAAIQNSYQLLEENSRATASNEDQELLDFIKTSADQMASIVKDLNLYSQEKEGLKDKCQLSEIVESSLNILKHSYKGRIELHKSYHEVPDLPCNRSKLNQVFTNLLSNAIQAIPGLGNIEISIEQKGQEIICLIKDDGHGISKEDLKRIQEPFFSKKQNGEGTGLGLFISEKILFDHGAQMEFESTLGKGTSVSIRFPLAKAEAPDT